MDFDILLGYSIFFFIFLYSFTQRNIMISTRCANCIAIYQMKSRIESNEMKYSRRPTFHNLICSGRTLEKRVTSLNLTKSRRTTSSIRSSTRVADMVHNQYFIMHIHTNNNNYSQKITSIVNRGAHCTFLILLFKLFFNTIKH